MKTLDDYSPVIEAVEYKKSCGRINLGGGIALIDSEGHVYATLEQGTIIEKRLALLWQASSALYREAREACEETRAFYDKHEDSTPPTWLAELEEAVRYAEKGPLKG